MKSLLGACVVAVALLAGCGGGSSTKTVTVNNGTGSPSGSPDSLSTTASEKQALQDFLSQLQPRLAKGNAATHKAQAAIDAYNNNQTTDHLKELGTTFGQTSATVLGVGNDMATLTPPASLSDSYSGYVAYVEKIGQLFSTMASDAKAGSAAAVTADLQGVDTSPSFKFKVAMIHALTQQGIAVPKFIQQIGESH